MSGEEPLRESAPLSRDIDVQPNHGENWDEARSLAKKWCM